MLVCDLDVHPLTWIALWMMNSHAFVAVCGRKGDTFLTVADEIRAGDAESQVREEAGALTSSS